MNRECDKVQREMDKEAQRLALKEKQTKMGLHEIAKLATEAGMTYGQYVLKMKMEMED